MNLKFPLYIAETDAEGHIDCVWIADSARAAVRPIRHPNRHLGRLKTAQCAGATPQAIACWLDHRARAATSH